MPLVYFARASRFPTSFLGVCCVTPPSLAGAQKGKRSRMTLTSHPTCGFL